MFLCMLAYYVEWHMRQKLAPILFDDEEPEVGERQRASIVAPAERSPSAQLKASTRCTADGLPVQSFATLLKNLATLNKNRLQLKNSVAPAFYKLTSPTLLQQKAFSLLGVTVSL